MGSGPQGQCLGFMAMAFDLTVTGVSSPDTLG